jgi:hypothetical protein
MMDKWNGGYENDWENDDGTHVPQNPLIIILPIDISIFGSQSPIFRDANVTILMDMSDMYPIKYVLNKLVEPN